MYTSVQYLVEGFIITEKAPTRVIVGDFSMIMKPSINY